MCPRVVQAQITTSLCTSNIGTWIHKSNKCLIVQSGNCTPGRLERLRSVLSCHSLGFLLSLLCRAVLSCFCLGILLPPFHNHFWNVWLHVSWRYYLPQYYHYILLSVAIVPFLRLRDSLSPLLWNLSLGIFLRLLALSLFFWWTCRVRVRIHPYQSIHVLVLAPFFGWTQRDRVRIRPDRLHVRTADHIKNGGPYRCLIRRAWNA